MNPFELDMENVMPETEQIRPGMYYVNVYLPLTENAGPGELEPCSVRLSYRARSEQHARARALQDHPEASIVNVDFHDPELDEDAVDLGEDDL